MNNCYFRCLHGRDHREFPSVGDLGGDDCGDDCGDGSGDGSVLLTVSNGKTEKVSLGAWEDGNLNAVRIVEVSSHGGNWGDALTSAVALPNGRVHCVVYDNNGAFHLKTDICGDCCRSILSRGVSDVGKAAVNKSGSESVGGWDSTDLWVLLAVIVFLTIIAILTYILGRNHAVL